MYDNIEQKLDFEWQVWFNFIYASSVADYLTRAFEIAVKRAIYRQLKNFISMDKLSTIQISYIMMRENFIDYMYLKCKDAGCLILRNEKIDDDEFENMLEIALV